MIIAITGNNAFAMQGRLNELRSAFASRYGELGIERIDAPEAGAQVIIDALQSLPFLSEKKMVIVRDVSASAEAMTQIEQIISATSKTTDLIIYDTLRDKRTAYFKTLRKLTKLEELNELDSQDLASWLVEEAKTRGGELKIADASYLIERVGNNQALLANELEKLLTYDTRLSRANIDLLTEPTPQSRIFDLLDAAFGGNKARALKLYEQQRAQKVEPHAILAMIAWQLQNLALVKAANGRSATAVAEDAGMSSFPIIKAERLASKIGEDRLRGMVNEAFNIDWRSKTSSIELDEALKTYIVTL